MYLLQRKTKSIVMSKLIYWVKGSSLMNFLSNHLTEFIDRVKAKYHFMKMFQLDSFTCLQKIKTCKLFLFLLLFLKYFTPLGWSNTEQYLGTGKGGGGSWVLGKRSASQCGTLLECWRLPTRQTLVQTPWSIPEDFPETLIWAQSFSLAYNTGLLSK